MTLRDPTSEHLTSRELYVSLREHLEALIREKKRRYNERLLGVIGGFSVACAVLVVVVGVLFSLVHYLKG